jgi:uncharacterized membrane protein
MPGLFMIGVIVIAIMVVTLVATLALAQALPRALYLLSPFTPLTVVFGVPLALFGFLQVSSLGLAIARSERWQRAADQEGAGNGRCH